MSGITDLYHGATIQYSRHVIIGRLPCRECALSRHSYNVHVYVDRAYIYTNIYLYTKIVGLHPFCRGACNNEMSNSCKQIERGADAMLFPLLWLNYDYYYDPKCKPSCCSMWATCSFVGDI